MKHTPNKKQECAFNSVIKAIKRAQKEGLVFYGKQDNLVAYTKQANDYIHNIPFEKTLATRFKAIPFLQNKVLSDSGADDYFRYISKEDEQKYD